MRVVLRTPRSVVAIVIATALFSPSVASAHALTILASQAEGNVEVRVGYGRTASTPAPSAKVRVKDATGTVIGEGQTDEAGVWRMPSPSAGEYTVEDDDHTGSVRLTITPSSVTRERPPVWPAVIAFTAVALVVGYWKYRITRSRSVPTPSSPASETP
jgi:hypothetical protein